LPEESVVTDDAEHEAKVREAMQEAATEILKTGGTYAIPVAVVYVRPQGPRLTGKCLLFSKFERETPAEDRALIRKALEPMLATIGQLMTDIMNRRRP
jgi:hypothetical protein